MKIYTSRKTNEVGQRAIDCLSYCCLPDINQTCTRILDTDNKFLPCKVRFGEVCENFEAGIGTKLYKE